MSMRRPRLTVKEQQKLKVLLDAIEDTSNGDIGKAEKQEEQVVASGCMEEGEIQRFIDLGLGRGVDVSNPTPWRNKTSIQVRPVTFDNITGTEESGSIQSYEREITRISETHWRFSPSAVFNPNMSATFSIGVEESYPQSQSSSKKYIVGTKVLNRTICFKQTSDDSSIELQPSSLMFEAWLCRWILKNYVKEDGRPVDVEGKIFTLKQELLSLSVECESLQSEFAELSGKHNTIVSEKSIEGIKAQLQELEHKKKVNKMEKEKLENKRKWFLNTLEKDYKKTGQMEEKQFKLEEFDQDFKFQDMKVNKEGDEIEGKLASLTEQCRSEMNELEQLETKLQATKSSLDEKEALLKEKKVELKRTQSHQFSIDELRRRLDMPELQRDKIAKYCSTFLAQFRVTHYVSSIQLGASGYKVVSKGKTAKSQKLQKSVRVDKIAAGSASRSSTKRLGQKSGADTVNKIGTMEVEEDGKVTVRRRSHQEGVVGVQVKPVSDLVTTQELREVVKDALLHYIRSEGDTSSYNYTEGPFLIRCEIDDKPFYWRVDDFHNVQAEECNSAEATHFYIKPRSHPEHPNDFYIVYFDSETKKHADPFMPHYLQRSATTLPAVFGSRSSSYHHHQHQQLKFGLYSRDKDTPLALYREEATRGSRQDLLSAGRQKRNWSGVSLTSWINKKEPCILQQTRHGLALSSFIIGVVLPPLESGEPSAADSAKPSDAQNDREEGEETQDTPESPQEQQAQEPQESQESVSQEEQGLPHGEEAVGESHTATVSSEYQVTWIQESSEARLRVVKMFEIVPVITKAD